MADEKDPRRNELRGRDNILAWLTRLETMNLLDDVVVRNTTTDKLELVTSPPTAAGTRPNPDPIAIANEKKLKTYIIKNCSDQVLHSITPSETSIQILEKLNAVYGFGNVDPLVIQQDIAELKFNPNHDPSITLNQLDIKLAELESAGGSLTESQVVHYMISALQGDPLRDTFWFTCAGHLKMDKLASKDVESTGRYICLFWNAHRVRKPNYSANNVNQSYEKRLCSHCKNAGRTRIMKTHNTAKCRIQDKEPDHSKPNEESNNVGNKTGKDYSLFHDSGTSKTMVNHTFGKNKMYKPIAIQTADTNQNPVIGTGTIDIQVGDIGVEAIVVPSFAKSLLSATQLSVEHGLKQVIDPWTAKLTITKDDVTVATGSFDPDTKLIKMDQHLSANNLEVNDWITIHRKLGHVGKKLMNKATKAGAGLTLSKNRFEALEGDCEACLETKAKRKNLKKQKKVIHNYDLLDVIEIDAQGPFSITANDGTCMNLKMIDYKSNWLKFATVKSLNAKDTLDLFINYQQKLERQTGKKIKRVRTDGGKEYMKDFLSYLDLSGIIKEKAVGYTHHHPGKAERTNKTILRNSKAMLKESKLPITWYNEAQNHAAYLFNRMPHGIDTISPYEHIFKRKPDLSTLQPFGCVCFAFVPPEKHHKLEDNGLKCRLLGYGDDFQTEEIKGYKLLNEDTGIVFFSDNVVFPKHIKFERLDDCYYNSNEDRAIDELFDPIINLSQVERENKSQDEVEDSSQVEKEESDDDFFSVQEEENDTPLHEAQHAELIKQLDKETWWRPKGVEFALRATTDGTPINYKTAISGPDKGKWMAAFKAELDSIKKNKTYKLRQTKDGERAIGCKWVLKIKLKPDGNIDKYKARLVAQGFKQRKGLDYNETFAPVAKFKSIRIMLALAGSNRWKVFHDDATSAFLNGNLHETILMDQPEGFVEINESYKWELLKTLYGLKQAPREWNSVLHNFMVEIGFTQCKSDPCLYVKEAGKDKIVVGIYVDDILSTGNNIHEIEKFRRQLKDKFQCSEGGPLTGCLGIEVTQNDGEIILSQEQYLLRKLVEFEQFLEPKITRSTPLNPSFQELLLEAQNSDEVEENFPYRQIIGSLMFASTATRPDLTTALGVLSRFNSKPKKIHCDMARHLLYYIRKFPNLSLFYRAQANLNVTGYVDSSWANAEDYK